MRKRKRVVKYKRRMGLNLGVIIFAVILCYVLFSTVKFMGTDQNALYEVVYGDVAKSIQKQGFIIRNEMAYQSETSGFINIYFRDGEKTSVGSTICTIDKSGNMEALLETNQAESTVMSQNVLREMKSYISQFNTSFRPENFAEIYDFKYKLNNKVITYNNQTVLGNLESISDSPDNNSFQIMKAPQSGIVSFTIDGYENITLEDINEGIFEEKNESAKLIKYGDTVKKDDFIYKVITGDEWKIAFPMSEEEINKIGDRESVQIQFLDKDIQTTADIEMQKIDGKYYGILSLNKYLENFSSNRFLQLEIIYDNSRGLKIPQSAITEKAFYKIPVSYLVQSGYESGFNKAVLLDGQESVQFVSTELFWADDDFYYVSTSAFESGDAVVKPESTEKYTISQTAQLKGVMNINKGFAVFKIIEQQSTSDQNYIIIKPNVDYSVSAYDHIALDGRSIQENENVK